MVPPARLAILTLCLAVATTAPAYSQSEVDSHLREDETRHLYSVSAFAHGHRHGYEEGFRVADDEIHSGRLQRALTEGDVPKSMEYQKSFGDKKHFRRGFIYGYLAGYRDSYEERSFRLPEWVAQVPPIADSSDLPQTDGPAAPDRKVRLTFDEGMMQGYRSGVSAQVVDMDAKALASQAGEVCELPGRSRADAFCHGFTHGFLFGVKDQISAPDSARSGLAKNVPQPH